MTNKITLENVKTHLPIRDKTAHKGDAGHVVVIGGGELHLAGGALLTAMAALNTGAGLVSLVVPSKSYIRISHAPLELMCYAIDAFNLDTAGFLSKADVIVIGPGLGQNAWSKQALTYVLTLNQAVLYDADALNLIAKDDLGASMFLTKESKSIFTPHPGEAARLLNTTIADVQSDREGACKKIAALHHTTVVLKGAESLVYNQANDFSLCDVANPALATAGSGDVLAGMIASFWAQGLDAYEAATCGVGLHASFADGKKKLVASDLVRAAAEFNCHD
jgi:hydroxyethylthiazole kinase-like uncharacterized protein yjeF